VFNPALPIVAQEVEAQTIVYRTDLFDKTIPQPNPLRIIHEALKNRLLNALPFALTDPRDPA
jgi:hypothetical protein